MLCSTAAFWGASWSGQLQHLGSHQQHLPSRPEPGYVAGPRAWAGGWDCFPAREPFGTVQISVLANPVWGAVIFTLQELGAPCVSDLLTQVSTRQPLGFFWPRCRSCSSTAHQKAHCCRYGAVGCPPQCSRLAMFKWGCFRLCESPAACSARKQGSPHQCCCGQHL